MSRPITDDEANSNRSLGWLKKEITLNIWSENELNITACI